MLSLASFIYLVIIGAVVGYTAYIWLLRHCDPAKVATYAYVNPIVAVLLGAAFAGETLSIACFDCWRADYRLSRDCDYSAATKSESRAARLAQRSNPAD